MINFDEIDERERESVCVFSQRIPEKPCCFWFLKREKIKEGNKRLIRASE